MPIHLKSSGTNVKTNYDGSVPTAFTCSNYFGMGNCSGGTNECASWTKSAEVYNCSTANCSLCSNYDPAASPTGPVTPTPVAPVTPTGPVTPYTPYVPTVTPVTPTPTESNSGDNFDPETYEATSLLDLFETGCTAA